MYGKYLCNNIYLKQKNDGCMLITNMIGLTLIKRFNNLK